MRALLPILGKGVGDDLPPNSGGRSSAWFVVGRVAAALGLAWVVGDLWEHPTFLWDVPPFSVIIVAVVAWALTWRRVPLLVTVWWLFGVLSLAWTLTPGATMVASLWTLTYVAVWSTGWQTALIAAGGWVLLQGVWSDLSLQLFGMTQYFSGSVEYLAGAVALLLFPWAFNVGTTQRWMPGRFGGLLVASLGAFAALASGSRGVYLAFMFVALVTIGRSVLRPHKVGATFTSIAVVALVVIVSNAAIPGSPIASAVGIKTKASVAALAPGLSGSSTGTNASSAGEPRVQGHGDENAISSRLKMWDQTLWIGLSHPLGTGLGSFRGTIASFQRYPSVNFASAHNVFLEILATEGWPGLLLLLAILLVGLLRGCRSPRTWPFAVGTAGVWLTMCFDITWSMPVIPLLAFWGLSVAHGGRSTEQRAEVRGTEPWRALRIGVSLVAGAAAVILVAAWYLPCPGAKCIMTRHLGYREEVSAFIVDSPPPARADLLRNLYALYPRSLWVRTLASSTATGESERISIDRDIVHNFPLASPWFYLDLARLLADKGDAPAAREVLETGLGRFPATLSPAGVPIESRSKEYATWSAKAQALLRSLSR